jgi:hypothetical protein
MAARVERPATSGAFAMARNSGGASFLRRRMIQVVLWKRRRPMPDLERFPPKWKPVGRKKSQQTKGPSVANLKFASV